MPKPADSKISTQQHIPFSAVYDDVLVTKKGQFCQIIMVNSVNFGLKSEEEQNSIIYQYQSFLNSLSFPIQIIMHSKRLDLNNYIKDMESRIPLEPNELIRYQIQEYVDFVQKLISIANIMDKKFFIIISHNLPPTEASGKGFGGLFGSPNVHLKVPLKKFLQIKSELTQKTNVISSGLASMGITSQVLSTKQIIELFYRIYNPDEAMKAQLEENVGSIGVQQQATEQTKPAVAQAEQGK